MKCLLSIAFCVVGLAQQVVPLDVVQRHDEVRWLSNYWAGMSTTNTYDPQHVQWVTTNTIDVTGLMRPLETNTYIRADYAEAWYSNRFHVPTNYVLTNIVEEVVDQKRLNKWTSSLTWDQWNDYTNSVYKASKEYAQAILDQYKDQQRFKRRPATDWLVLTIACVLSFLLGAAVERRP